MEMYTYLYVKSELNRLGKKKKWKWFVIYLTHYEKDIPRVSLNS